MLHFDAGTALDDTAANGCQYFGAVPRSGRSGRVVLVAPEAPAFGELIAPGRDTRWKAMARTGSLDPEQLVTGAQDVATTCLPSMRFLMSMRASRSQ